MTDQGALERARGIVSLVLHKQWLFVNMSGSDRGLYGDREAVAREIAAALTAAEAKGRAAAIEECIEAILKMCREYSGVLPSQDGFLESLSRCVVPVLRALDTPAQCEHHWIGGNDGEWCTKCKEERSNAPAQSEGK